MQLQLDNLEVTTNLALMTRYTELSSGLLAHNPARRAPGDSGHVDTPRSATNSPGR
jgi:hypothetical protein